MHPTKRVAFLENLHYENICYVLMVLVGSFLALHSRSLPSRFLPLGVEEGRSVPSREREDAGADGAGAIQVRILPFRGRERLPKSRSSHPGRPTSTAASLHPKHSFRLCPGLALDTRSLARFKAPLPPSPQLLAKQLSKAPRSCSPNLQPGPGGRPLQLWGASGAQTVRTVQLLLRRRLACWMESPSSRAASVQAPKLVYAKNFSSLKRAMARIPGGLREGEFASVCMRAHMRTPKAVCIRGCRFLRIRQGRLHHRFQ